MGKYGTAGQATDDNIKRRVRITCRINTATNTHSAYVILPVPPPPAKMVARTRLNITLYVHCTCCFHQRSSSTLRQDHVSPCVRSCCPSAVISTLPSAVPRHPCNGFLPNSLSKKQSDELGRSETLSVQIL